MTNLFNYLLAFEILTGLSVSDPGRDLCKIYHNGLKCSHMTSQYFPYDAFLSFNDDLARFTTEMKFLQIDSSNISILQSRSFQRTPHLSHLILSGIHLGEVEQGAFEGLTRLKLADLSYNSIRTLPVDSFKHTKIYRLNLNGNKNLEIPVSGPFLSAAHLSWLSLYDCSIVTINDKTFSELPFLSHLNLGKNRLKSLPETVFRPLKHLSFLDLSENEFQTFDIKLLESSPLYPKHPSSLILADNPWTCDCNIAPIANWITQNEFPAKGRSKKSRKGVFKNRVFCRKPENLAWNSAEFRALISSC